MFRLIVVNLHNLFAIFCYSIHVKLNLVTIYMLYHVDLSGFFTVTLARLPLINIIALLLRRRLLFLDETVEHVDGKGKDDGGVLLGAD